MERRLAVKTLVIELLLVATLSVTPRTREELAPPLRDRIAALVEEERSLMRADPSIEAEVLDTARRELLRAERREQRAARTAP